MTTVLAVFVGIYWIVAPNLDADAAPDLLAEQFGSYFEREGFCFNAKLEHRGDLCIFAIHLQNHWSKPCEGTVHFLPMEGSLADAVDNVEPVQTDFSLDGGEAGVIRIPYAIPRRLHGELRIYDVYAEVVYPQSRGDVVRSRRGLRVEPLRSALSATLHQAARVMIHHPKLRNATIEMRMPTNVVEELPADTSVEVESLWRLTGDARK